MAAVLYWMVSRAPIAAECGLKTAVWELPPAIGPGGCGPSAARTGLWRGSPETGKLTGENRKIGRLGSVYGRKAQHFRQFFALFYFRITGQKIWKNREAAQNNREKHPTASRRPRNSK